MKKRINSLYILLCTLLSAFLISSCDDNDRDNLDIVGSTQITSFVINGQEGAIDEQARSILVMLNKNTDLSKLSPQITLSEGATVQPVSGAEMNLSKTTSYLVKNGNLYTEYKVIAAHIIGRFLTFNIGKYKGSIDNDHGTILIRVPETVDVTHIVPDFTLTEGATVSPEAGTKVDFSQPVKYTISYMGESFEYLVTVEKAAIKPIGYLNVANTAEGLENEDERAAYQWLVNNMPDVQYISFNDIKNGVTNLNDFAVIWFYTDGNTRSLPTQATEGAVVESLKAYYQQGGSFFFSSWAVQYPAVLGIAKDGKSVNNMWGETNTPFEIGEDWGICFTGKESHPIFKGLNTPVGINNKVYLIGKGAKVKAHNSLWNFAEDWVEYQWNMAGWSRDSGAVSLASFHWDDNADSRSVMFEYLREGNRGAAVCIGSEAYDWSVEGENTLQANLEQLTVNILTYLIN